MEEQPKRRSVRDKLKLCSAAPVLSPSDQLRQETLQELVDFCDQRG